VIRLKAGLSRNCGSICSRNKGFFSSPQRLDWPCSPVSLAFNGEQGLFCGGGKMVVALMITRHLMPILRMCGALPTLLHVPSCHAEQQLYLYHR